MPLDPWASSENQATEEPSKAIEHLLQEVSSTAYSLYSALIVYGCILLVIGSLMIVIEVTTTPQITTATMWVTLAATTAAMGHLYIEVQNLGKRALWRWGVFAASLIMLVTKPLSLSRTDPIAVIVMCAALGTGAAMIVAARLWLVPCIEGFLRWPWTLQVLLGVVAWLSVPVAIVIACRV